MTAPSARVLAALPEIRAWAERLYRELHASPELSLAEYQTSARVASELKAMPGARRMQLITGIAGTGVAAVIRNGTGPTVLLRADMDGLPVLEDTGLPYASTVMTSTGSGEVVPVMHACGHDMHVASLLGALRLLLTGPGEWSGTLVAVFQPAEERYNGARAMLADNLTGRVPWPDVAFGQHVFPGPSGTVGVSAGPVMAASADFIATVRGRGGHGSAPHLAIDPVVIAASLVTRLQGIVSRQLPPDQTVVLTVGRLIAGTKSNIIADHAVLDGTVRAYDDALVARALTLAERALRAEASSWGAPGPDFQIYDRVPVTSNDPQVSAQVAAAFAAEFGAENVRAFTPMMGAEDFSELPGAWGAPYCFWSIGAFDAHAWALSEAAGTQLEDFPDNHSPQFAPVLQPTLDTGIRALVSATMAWLGRPG